MISLAPAPPNDKVCYRNTLFDQYVFANPYLFSVLAVANKFFYLSTSYVTVVKFSMPDAVTSTLSSRPLKVSTTTSSGPR